MNANNAWQDSNKKSYLKKIADRHLKLFGALWRQFGKVDAAAEEDVGRFRNPVHLPAQVLEERGEPEQDGRKRRF